MCVYIVFFFFQAEDGIRDLVRSRGLGDVYKRQRYAAWLPDLLRSALLKDPGLLLSQDERDWAVKVLSLIHI